MQPANILVADDDAVARDLLAEALKKEGYTVEAFAVEKRSSIEDARGV